MTPLICLAAAIFFEAGVEDIEGKRMVGSVVMNRVEDKRYPDDVCSVIYEDKQFSFTHDGKSNSIPVGEVDSLVVAEDILRGNTSDITSTHYIADYARANWTKVFTFDGKYGTHLFYTNETKWR